MITRVKADTLSISLSQQPSPLPFLSGPSIERQTPLSVPLYAKQVFEFFISLNQHSYPFPFPSGLILIWACLSNHPFTHNRCLNSSSASTSTPTPSPFLLG